MDQAGDIDGPQTTMYGQSATGWLAPILVGPERPKAQAEMACTAHVHMLQAAA